MKNYYIQLSELKIAEQRKITLLEKKDLLLNRMTNCTSHLKDVVTAGGMSNDKMNDYLIKCEEIDKQLEEVDQEIKILKKGLHQMNEILTNISGIEEKIFRLYYIEGKTPRQISFIVPLSEPTIYRKLKKIKEKIKNDKK